MKKIYVLLLLMTPVVLQFCSSSKNAATKVPKITYTANVKPIMEAHCTPCHFPPKGNKTPYDTYVRVKVDIDQIVDRVSRNPTDKGFMPIRHPKLSDSTINVLVQWKKDGLLEN
jgi:hypothetical protein